MSPSLPTSRSPLRERSPSVLALGRSRAEWLGAATDGQPAYGCAEVSGCDPGAFVTAAVEALVDSGARRGPCILSLDDSLVAQRSLFMPDLPRKELTAIFRRKAAQSLEAKPEDTLFTCCMVDPQAWASDADAKQSTWNLCAVSRSWMTAVRMGLRGRGFRVRRVVSARAASLLTGLGGDGKGCRVTVLVEPDAVCVSLTTSDRWILRYELNGDYLASPGMGASLLQDVRNCVGFFRKVSRGGTVEEIKVLGLAQEHAQPMAEAIRDSHEGVEVEWRPTHPGHPKAGRIDTLQTALVCAHPWANLTSHLPPSRRWVMAVCGVALALVAIVGVPLWGELERSAGATLQETVFVDQRSADLERSEADIALARAGVEELAQRVERRVSVEHFGISMHDVLGGALEALDEGVELLGLEMEPLEGGARQVRLEGLAPVEATAMTTVLRDVANQLRAQPHWGKVHVQPPAQVPRADSLTGESASATTRFVLDAHYGGVQ